MFNFEMTGRLKAAAVAAAAFGSLAVPCSAHAGFFEQLFGAPPSPPAPTYSYERPSTLDLAPALPRVSRHALAPSPFAHRLTRRVAARDIRPKANGAPVLQKTTDLMSDKTLRAGDAVMMKDGIHIYDGRESAKHNIRQFVALDEAQDVKSAERSALVAMDTTRNDPLRSQVVPDTIASGRSAAVGAPAVSGFRITDARGRSVRYVGP